MPASSSPDIVPAAPGSPALVAVWLDARDDVTTVLRAIAAGERLQLRCGEHTRDVVVREAIPLGHKVALHAMARGRGVRKYGELIGNLTADVAEGGWVHTHNLDTAARHTTACERAEAGADALPAAGDTATDSATDTATNPARTDAGERPSGGSGSAQGGSASVPTFEGYRRPDGRVGVRNHVLVLSPTGLTSAAALRIADLVRGTIAVTTGYGRGQVGADAKLQIDTLCGLATHPNVAAVLVVSAADDITSVYVDAARAAGKPVVGLSLPAVQEDALTLVDRGVRHATRLVREASELRRTTCPASELVVAVECGHSDATSGIVCNPLVGRMMERVVDCGGTAMFSETVEWTGAERILAQRAATPDVARDIMAAVDRRERMVREAGGDVRGQNPGPQNKAGGLTTIEEKALGAIAKGGRQPIQGVLLPAQRPPRRGLYLMDTPFFSPESITAMVAAGAQLVCFTTGAGNSYCSLVAPTLKVSAHPETCARLTEQIDLPASGVLAGALSLETMAQEGFGKLLAVASGSLTFGEIVGEGAEVVSRLGPSM